MAARLHGGHTEAYITRYMDRQTAKGSSCTSANTGTLPVHRLRKLQAFNLQLPPHVEVNYFTSMLPLNMLKITKCGAGCIKALILAVIIKCVKL